MRAYGLDSLRGIAMLMVLWTHTGIEPITRAVQDPDAQWLGLAHNFMRLTGFGIDIFFVLSGFLVSSMIFNELGKYGRIDYRRFWLRRGLKVWPAYYLVYGSWAVLFSVKTFIASGWSGVGEYWSGAWTNLIFLQNYVYMDTRWFASWSLAVEEHFYLALPAIVILMLRMGWSLRYVPVLCITGILVCVFLRYQAAFQIADPRQFGILWIQTHFRLDSLLSGVLLGFIYTLQPQIWKRLLAYRRTFLTVSLVCFAVQYVLINRPEYAFSFGMLLMAVAGVSLVIYFFGVQNEVVNGNRLLNLFRKVGNYSYSIYVCQCFGVFAYYADRLTPDTPLQYVPIGSIGFWSVSIMMGIIVHRIIENPVLAVRDKVLPSKAPGIVSQRGAA